jgi:hypothetical protein
LPGTPSEGRVLGRGNLEDCPSALTVSLLCSRVVWIRDGEIVDDQRPAA